MFRAVFNTCIKLAISGCLLILFFDNLTCKLHADTAYDSLKISDIAAYSGASNDPFLSFVYLPCFNLPSLNRFPYIIRGATQSTNAVFIDSIQVDFNLGNSSGASPYFFDGYRSWFNGSQNASVSVSPSFTPVDQGGGTGANVFLTHNKFADALVLNAIGSYSDASISLESPLFSKNIHFGCDGRFGYNGRYIRNWIEPYTSSANVIYNFPRYGDFGAIVKIENILNSTITMNFKNAFEGLSLQAPSTYYSDKADSYYQLNFGSARITTGISESIANQFKFGCSNLISEDSSGYIHLKNDFTVFNLSDEITFKCNCFQSYIGIQVKTNSTYGEDLYLSANGSSVYTTFDNYSTMISPFSRIHLQFPSNLLFDIGFRIDKYKQLNSNSGLLLYLSPSVAAKDSAPFDLTYRLRFEYPVLKRLSLVLESGTYNQPPSAVELQSNKDLLSIKSSKHALSVISKVSNKLSIQGSLYYHYFWDTPMYADWYDVSNEPSRLQSKGESHSKGLECVVRYHPLTNISCLLGYSLSKSEEYYFLTGKMERQSFDRLNKITGHISYASPYGLKASAGAIFSTGVPVTKAEEVKYNESTRSYYIINGKYNSATGKNYFTLNCRIDYSRTIGKVDLGAFVEGRDLLKSSIDKGYNYDYSSGGLIENIDKRSIDFGLTIRY
jgi:hypothetical protein